jgi:hypothetical protein
MDHSPYMPWLGCYVLLQALSVKVNGQHETTQGIAYRLPRGSHIGLGLIDGLISSCRVSMMLANSLLVQSRRHVGAEQRLACGRAEAIAGLLASYPTMVQERRLRKQEPKFGCLTICRVSQTHVIKVALSNIRPQVSLECSHLHVFAVELQFRKGGTRGTLSSYLGRSCDMSSTCSVGGV